MVPLPLCQRLTPLRVVLQQIDWDLPRSTAETAVLQTLIGAFVEVESAAGAVDEATSVQKLMTVIVDQHYRSLAEDFDHDAPVARITAIVASATGPGFAHSERQPLPPPAS